MSSVGSLSTSTSTSIRGYGGLASGLDRDELIEGMTIGTRTKINKQEQKKQQIEWMQEAVRTISDKMISFHGKYTETLTSPTNLFSSMLWGRNKITTFGNNANKISVSGSANTADAITVMGVKQKAENAKWASANTVSDGKLVSGDIDTADKVLLDGTTLNFEYEGKTYGITLKAGEHNLKSFNDVADAINSLLKNAKSDDGSEKDLSTIIQAKATGDGLSFKNTSSVDVKLTSGSALNTLGFGTDIEIKTGEEASGAELKDSNLYQTFAQRVGGKSLTFTYNGTSRSVTIPGADTLEGKETNAARMDAIAKSLQEQLQSAFGKGRIKVLVDENNKLIFQTTVPGGDDDKSSVLTLSDGDAAGALGMRIGESTRLNLNAEIKQSGIAFKNDEQLPSDKLTFMVNGDRVDINIDEKETLNSLMAKINKDSRLNMTISYQEAVDKFTITSKDNGASGEIAFASESKDLAEKLFGLELDGQEVYEIAGKEVYKITEEVDGNTATYYTDVEGNKLYKEDAGKNILYLDDTNVKDGNDANVTADKLLSDKFSVKGQDAIVAVRYAGTDDIVELHRDSNTFTVDGLTIGVKGTFGYKEDGKINEDDAVEINAAVDVDKLMDTIKSFVEDYNAIVDMVNTELTTKHEKDYAPLSSEQKSEMSEDEIEKWEAKAKSGLLYGDSDLRNLSMDLRTVATSYVWELGQIGISVSSSYSDNGKLSIDETKLRSALETDPESVEKLFTATEGIGADGKKIYNGVATNLKSVMDKYVNTMGASDRKGILIRKAGSKSSALSMTDNTYYNQLQSIEKLIASLNDRLKTERDRYVKQFASLETLISNMNSQSSYLSSMSGY